MTRDRLVLPLSVLATLLLLLLIVIPHATVGGADLEPQPNHPLTPTVESRNLALVDQIGGVSMAVAVRNDLAFLGEGPRLRILDVSNPSTPILIGSTPPLPGAVRDIAIQGERAYVGLGDAGLRIFDIADPTTPREIGQWDEGWPVYRMAVDGDLTYVLYGGLGILDISDPASIEIVNSDLTIAKDLMAADGYVYLTTDEGLQIFDMADPAHPTRVGQLDIAGGGTHLALAGHLISLSVHVYECGYFDCYEFNELVVVDVTDKSSPQRLGDLEVEMELDDLAADGPLAAANTGGYVQVFDLSDPAQPVNAGEVHTPGLAPFQIALIGPMAYLADFNSGLRLISLADPAAPVEVGAYEEAMMPIHMSVSGNYAYIAGANNGLQVMELASPTQLRLIGALDISGYLGDLAVAQEIVYAADSFYGLRIIDITDPLAPTEIGSLATFYGADAVAVQWPYAYVASRAESLHIVDVRNPAAPVEVGRMPMQDWSHSIAVIGSILYIASDSAGLRLVDVSDPREPREIGLLDTPGSAQDVAVAGHYAYVADVSGGLRIIDVSDPARPVEVGREISLGAAVAVTINEEFVYVADMRGGLRVLDASDPTLPIDAGFFDDGGEVRGVTVNDDVVYALDASLGIWVLDHYGPHIITGTVLADGRPLPGVWVNAGTRHAVTGSDGTYRLTRLQVGTYTVAARRAGYTLSPSTSEVTVPPNAAQVDFSAVAWDQWFSIRLPVVDLP